MILLGAIILKIQLAVQKLVKMENVKAVLQIAELQLANLVVKEVNALPMNLAASVLERKNV